VKKKGRSNRKRIAYEKRVRIDTPARMAKYLSAEALIMPIPQRRGVQEKRKGW